jgi:hypothetical protein
MAKGILTEGNCCEDCKHLEVVPLGLCEGCAYECWHQSNLKSYYDWLRRWQRPKRHPKRRNRDNRCIDFTPKQKDK